MGELLARPETATNILENGLFDLPRFYEGCPVRSKSVTKVLETALFDFRDFFTKSSSSGFVLLQKRLFLSEVVIPTLQGRSKSDLFFREKNSLKIDFRTFRFFPKLSF